MELGDIARRLGGTLHGDSSIEVSGANNIENAKEREITFLRDRRMLDPLRSSRASAVIVSEPVDVNMAQVVHPEPDLAFAEVVAELYPERPPEPGVSEQATVRDSVELGEDVTVFPYAYIGNNVKLGDRSVVHPGVVIHDDCEIGNDCVLNANATLYRRTRIGNRVVLHAGAVLGADGFGYKRNGEGEHVKIQQVGCVVVEDDVEVGANTCIDRATFGATVIRQGSKIDNLVQIAHNCDIGAHSILVAQVGIAGSCQLGHHVVLAGQVGLADHVRICDEAMLAAKAGANKSIPEKGLYSGVPAVPGTTWRRYVAALPKLPEMTRRLRELEKRVQELEGRSAV